MFAIACALRLARFNVMIDDPDDAGLAQELLRRHAGAGGRDRRPAAGLSALARSSDAIEPRRASSRLEIAYVLAIALLMASRVPHFSGKSIGRVPREYVAVGADRRWRRRCC